MTEEAPALVIDEVFGVLTKPKLVVATVERIEVESVDFVMWEERATVGIKEASTVKEGCRSHIKWGKI